MIELVLVRHGQPDWEPEGRAVDEPELTSLGHQQAESVAEALAGEHFDSLHVSPLLRTQQTMEPIARRLGMEPVSESWLAELRLPPLEGSTSKEVQEFFAHANARELEHWWDGLPGGESFRHFYERVTGGVENWLDASCAARIHEDTAHRLWTPAEPQKLLIVAHEGTNAVLISHLLGIEPVPWAWLRFRTAWCGINRIQMAEVAGGCVWTLRSFNRIDHQAHLPPEHGLPIPLQP
ncbi:MAG: histidine phosphatase family protein [bacterium]|nr:histidine phosphatase family protein [bacterium]